MHLSYLRKYGEYRITVETLNRVCFTTLHVLALFVKRTHNMSSVLNFWNRFIRFNWPTFQSQSSHPISEKCFIL